MQLLQDKEIFRAYYNNALYEYCSGCFSRELCYSIQNKLREQNTTLEEYLVDELKVLPETFYPRWSSVGNNCEISKILAVINKEKLPPEHKFPDFESSRVGTVLHAAFNQQHRDDFVHNLALKKIDEEPVSRKTYCEQELSYQFDDFKITGHCDALYMLVKK